LRGLLARTERRTARRFCRSAGAIRGFGPRQRDSSAGREEWGERTDVAGETPAATTSRFPDTTATIAILSDQLPTMTAQQQGFAATHYVGSQKLVLETTRELRALNPNFVVLHYHLPCGSQRHRSHSSLTGCTGRTTTLGDHARELVLAQRQRWSRGQ